MPEVHEGGCHCGSVRYRVVREPMIAGICHCTSCKRRTGSAFGLSAYFDDANVKILSGALKIYEYRSDDDKRWLRTEFCVKCGSTVTWTGELLTGLRGIAGGTLDDPNWIEPDRHIWTRSALHWVTFPSDTVLFETAGIKPE
jgi:hypothetical protein